MTLLCVFNGVFLICVLHVRHYLCVFFSIFMHCVEIVLTTGCKYFTNGKRWGKTGGFRCLCTDYCYPGQTEIIYRWDKHLIKFLLLKIWFFDSLLKGSDRLCKVVHWTEYAVLWKSSFGFIWDILNFLKICKSWVWAQIRRSKLLLWGWIRFQNTFFF